MTASGAGAAPVVTTSYYLSNTHFGCRHVNDHWFTLTVRWNANRGKYFSRKLRKSVKNLTVHWNNWQNRDDTNYHLTNTESSTKTITNFNTQLQCLQPQVQTRSKPLSENLCTMTTYDGTPLLQPTRWNSSQVLALTIWQIQHLITLYANLHLANSISDHVWAFRLINLNVAQKLTYFFTHITGCHSNKLTLHLTTFTAQSRDDLVSI